MYKYSYTREIINNGYNINNSERIDGQGNKIYLINEIETLLPNKIFKLFCSGNFVTIVFYDSQLTDGEKIDLDECVYNHKNNL